MPAHAAATEGSHPESIGGRYEVAEVLGRGGMAIVFRVTDTVSGRQMALKRLVLPPSATHGKESAALFEGEFHVLAQLAHPRIIEVYDYGVDDEGPYYTMELLDGWDLRERSPMPWREACSLLYDVCSSLALIHSRRMVHRDVSPRNIRCTRDGQAKLIDFGTMVSMGHSDLVVGTPPFVAPEVVHLSALDARTDLFSLGATLYYVLTGRAAYPAREFSQLFAAWKVKPAPPGRLVEGIPSALDDLVLALLSLEPAMRPRIAFEVMHRLAAIAGIERVEPASVSQAYLSTPVLVGRAAEQGTLRRTMERAFGGRGHGVLIRGAAGAGRSRMLDATVLEAKQLGATVLRAGGGAAKAGEFAVAQALAEQLVEALPDTALPALLADDVARSLLDASPPPEGEAESPARPRLRDLTNPTVARLASQTALCRWMLRVSERHPVAIAVDDAHRIDAPSAALLAALSSQAGRSRLLVAATAPTDARATDPAALEVLVKRSVKVTLQPLASAETAELLLSVFGDVPNLGLVSNAIHKVSAGNPRACLDLAQHLVDRGSIRYDGGSWSLPGRLRAEDLPSSAEDEIRQRIDALTPSARLLAAAQALASHEAISREEYARLALLPEASDIDPALSELLREQVLVKDSHLYRLAHRGLCPALTAQLGDADRQGLHRALVALYDVPLEAATIHHLLEGGLHEQGLDRLAELWPPHADRGRAHARAGAGGRAGAVARQARGDRDPALARGAQPQHGRRLLLVCRT